MISAYHLIFLKITYTIIYYITTYTIYWDNDSIVYYRVSTETSWNNNLLWIQIFYLQKSKVYSKQILNYLFFIAKSKKKTTPFSQPLSINTKLV